MGHDVVWLDDLRLSRSRPVVVATMNIGMLIWLVVRLLMECVCESRENAAAAANANESDQITRIMSNLQMSMHAKMERCYQR